MALRTRLVLVVAVLVLAGIGTTAAVAWVAAERLVLSQVDLQLLIAAQSPGGRTWTVDRPVVGDRVAAIGQPPTVIPGGGPPVVGSTTPPRTYPDTPYGSTLAGGAPLVWMGFDDEGDLLGVTGEQLDRRPPPDITPLREPSGTVQVDTYRSLVADGAPDIDYRALTVAGADGRGVLLVATPTDDVIDRIDAAHRTVLVTAVLALALAVAVGWTAVGRALRPVRDLERGVARLADGRLDARVAPTGTGDEVGRLVDEFNAMGDQLEVAFADRERAEAQLRRFVADASHELRTPLTSILGYAELYEDGALADRDGTDRAMARIAAETERLAALVDDLLALASVEQRQVLQQADVDLGPLVQEVVDDARAADPDRSITCDVASGAVVRGDADRLRQVVTNLVGNARTHTGPEVPVLVRTEQDDDEVRVVVRDEGPGMDADTAARIFERFFRGDRDAGSPGTGLGLPIASSIVAAHGGSITVDTAPGDGATFVIHLPRATTPR